MKTAILAAGLILSSIQANAAETPAGTSSVSLKDIQGSTQSEVLKSIESDIVTVENNRVVAQNQAQVAQAMRLASGNSVVNFGALQDAYEFQQADLEKQREDLQSRVNIQRKLEAESLRTKSN